MDLIIQARGAKITIEVDGKLKAVSADDKEVKFYISGEEDIREASKKLTSFNIWHNPYPYYLGIPFEVGDLEPRYKAEIQFNL